MCCINVKKNYAFYYKSEQIFNHNIVLYDHYLVICILFYNLKRNYRVD